MNYLKLCMVILILLFASNANGLEDDALALKMLKLDWQMEAGNYNLKNHMATVTTSENEWLLKGEEAHKGMLIMQGHDGFKPDLLVMRMEGPSQDTSVLYTFHELGFIKMDDWDDYIQKDALLKEIKKNTEKANQIKEKGYEKLYVDNWAQEPFLDEKNAIVYWAIAGHSDDGISFVNVKALKLGRKGLTIITWMGTAGQFINAEKTLMPILAAYKYNEDFRYASFDPGLDTVAALGVGALSYNLITGKSSKAAAVGIVALIVAFAKKLWFLIFLPFVFAWNWIKKSLWGSKKEDL